MILTLSASLLGQETPLHLTGAAADAREQMGGAALLTFGPGPGAAAATLSQIPVVPRGAEADVPNAALGSR